ARLDHEHLAAVYEATPDALVMQFIDGVPLSTIPIDDFRRVARLVRDAARAVHHAHEHGVVHRDLKPQNLLVEPAGPDGREERIVVTDFGLAKDLDDRASLSISGHVLGTPSFMAPEQAAADPDRIDARTDVWGLGATLFERLVGRPPFVDGDVLRLLRRVAEEDAPRPGSLRRDLPRDLDLIVRRALESDPARRYPSAAALADDLDRFLTHRPILARAPSVAYRTRRFVRRHRTLVVLAGAAVLALAVAGFVALDEHVRSRASSAALRLSEEAGAVLADAALERRLGDVERAERRLDEGIARCRGFLDRHDVPHARFLLGRLLRARGETEAARIALDRAIAADPTLFEARLERGLLVADGEPAPADAARAVADLDAALASPTPSVRRVDRAHARAERARLTGDLDGARRAFEEVLRLDPLSTEARLGLSRVALAEGDDDAAWGLAMSAVDLHQGFGPAYLARSSARRDDEPGSAGDAVDRAVRQHELAAAEQRVDARAPSAAALLRRAGARLELDDVEGALSDFSAAVRRDPSNATALGQRGLVHARRAADHGAAGRLDDAIDAWGAAVEDWESALVLEPALAGAHNNRGVARLERERLLRARGRPEDAVIELDRAGEALDAAIAAAPGFVVAHGNRAVHRRRTAERRAAAFDEPGARAAIVEARADLDAVLRARPDDADAIEEAARLERLERALDARR
ncbi:MAG: protein kinase, partial [Planctomycetota bacterium JB042]